MEPKGMDMERRPGGLGISLVSNRSSGLGSSVEAGSSRRGTDADDGAQAPPNRRQVRRRGRGAVRDMTATVHSDVGKALGTDYSLLRGELTEAELDYLDRTRSKA
jgi:hypothetical protein